MKTIIDEIRMNTKKVIDTVEVKNVEFLSPFSTGRTKFDVKKGDVLKYDKYREVLSNAVNVHSQYSIVSEEYLNFLNYLLPHYLKELNQFMMRQTVLQEELISEFIRLQKENDSLRTFEEGYRLKFGYNKILYDGILTVYKKQMVKLGQIEQNHINDYKRLKIEAIEELESHFETCPPEVKAILHGIDKEKEKEVVVVPPQSFKKTGRKKVEAYEDPDEESES